MPDIEEDRLITTSEPARLLGCHAVTVNKKCTAKPPSKSLPPRAKLLLVRAPVKICC
jgi:hypothetical protein